MDQLFHEPGVCPDRNCGETHNACQDFSLAAQFARQARKLCTQAAVLPSFVCFATIPTRTNVWLHGKVFPCWEIPIRNNTSHIRTAIPRGPSASVVFCERRVQPGQAWKRNFLSCSVFVCVCVCTLIYQSTLTLTMAHVIGFHNFRFPCCTCCTIWPGPPLQSSSSSMHLDFEGV